MKPEITKELATELINIISGMKNFTIEQAPSICKEILEWQRTVATEITIIFGLIFVLSIYCFISVKDGKHEWMIITAGVSYGISLIMLAMSSFFLIRTFTSQKLLLLDCLKGML